MGLAVADDVIELADEVVLPEEVTVPADAVDVGEALAEQVVIVATGRVGQLKEFDVEPVPSDCAPRSVDAILKAKKGRTELYWHTSSSSDGSLSSFSPSFAYEQTRRPCCCEVDCSTSWSPTIETWRGWQLYVVDALQLLALLELAVVDADAVVDMLVEAEEVVVEVDEADDVDDAEEAEEDVEVETTRVAVRGHWTAPVESRWTPVVAS